MVIKTHYEETVRILSLLLKVVAKKGISDAFKVVNIFVKDSSIYLGSTDGSLFCLTKLEGSFDLGTVSEEDSYFAINIKETLDILDKFKSLQRTVVDELEFYIQNEGVILTVKEVAKDTEDPNSHSYNQGNKFFIKKDNPLGIFIKELPEIIITEGASEGLCEDLYESSVYSYPLLTTPKDIMYLHYTKQGIYSIIGNHYGVLMKNRLPEGFEGFSFTPYVVAFLKEIMSKNDKFKFERSDIWGPSSDGSKKKVGVVLNIGVANILMRVKIPTLLDTEIPAPFLPKPTTIVEIDKFYLLDTLKRVTNYDTLYIEVDIKSDSSEIFIKTAKSKQRVPVKRTQGEGKYVFAVNPAHLRNIIFSHMTKTVQGDPMDDLILGFRECEDKRNVELTCLDKTDTWLTKYPRAPKRELPDGIFE